MSDKPTASQSAYFVVLCQGKRAEGDDYWAYLQIAPDKAKAFKQAQASGDLVLEEYGEIIEWGLAAQVPDEVKAHMEKEHGVNHGFEDALRQKIAEQ